MTNPDLNSSTNSAPNSNDSPFRPYCAGCIIESNCLLFQHLHFNNPDASILTVQLPFTPISYNNVHTRNIRVKTGRSYTSEGRQQKERVWMITTATLMGLRKGLVSSRIYEYNSTSGVVPESQQNALSATLQQLPFSGWCVIQYTYFWKTVNDDGSIKNRDAGNPVLESNKFLQDCLEGNLLKKDSVIRWAISGKPYNWNPAIARDDKTDEVLNLKFQERKKIPPREFTLVCVAPERTTRRTE